MDLTLPYTFYPIALPHWIAWTLFLIAVAGGTLVGVVKNRRRGWRSRLFGGVVCVIGLLAASMVASMIITFFLHDLKRPCHGVRRPKRDSHPGPSVDFGPHQTTIRCPR